MTDFSRAGPLSATLDGMGLRWVQWHGVEILRGVAFVVRDADWGTYAPEVHTVQQDTAAITLAAKIRAGAATLDCTVTIEMRPDRISLEGRAVAQGDFSTNRTGFVLLHGEACVGQPVTVEHADGQQTAGRFPALISPHQPFLDVSALTHAPHPGLLVRCAMQGETFEMEDHRNWSDAGFKTYCRPLSRPRPFLIRDGEAMRQRVDITIDDRAASPPPAVTLPPETGRERYALPRLVLYGPPAEVGHAAAEADLLLADISTTAELASLAAAPPRRPWGVLLRATEHGAAEIEALAGLVPDLAVLLIVHADAAMLGQARQAFPNCRIGAGSGQNFAEFNRAPPPADADFVFWGVCPTVHAFDDASVMETLRVLGDQARTAAALRPGKPQWAGPVAFRLDRSPDPREATAFGAAFLLGQIAEWTRAGASAVLLPLGWAQQPRAAAVLASLRAAVPPFAPVSGLAVRGLMGDGFAAVANLTKLPVTAGISGRSLTLEAYDTACEPVRVSS